MAHWAQRYVGRPFVAGEHDCADLVVAVAREQFGREVRLPQHAHSLRGRDAQIALLKDTLGRPVDAPREGDVVLMRQAGRRRTLGHHLGVWCDPGEPSVLHCLGGLGTCLHPLYSLAKRQLEVTGIYRWT